MNDNTKKSSGISVIIRAKNEEKWISSCLFAVAMQDFSNVEIIVVDNESNDDTVKIAKSFNAQIIEISDKEFNYSKALNMGIKASSNNLIAILSAHCIPLHEHWLSSLASHFLHPNVVAVYGRQEPLPDSSPFDKRDLWTTFGLEQKVQKKDFFFHNANSMIRKDIWTKHHFNEQLFGVEDREWAKRVLKKGRQIIYDPHASVYHHHGIHHSGNQQRAKRVVAMIERIQCN